MSTKRSLTSFSVRISSFITPSVEEEKENQENGGSKEILDKLSQSTQVTYLWLEAGLTGSSSIRMNLNIVELEASLIGSNRTYQSFFSELGGLFYMVFDYVIWRSYGILRFVQHFQ